LLLGGGCGREPPAQWTDWRPAAPEVRRNAAFEAYFSLGLEAETENPEDARRTGFLPGQRERASRRLATLTSRLREATRGEFVFVLEPREPGDPAPARAGWRLLGRAMAWRTEDLAKAGRYDEAISWGLAAMKFGYDLTGGSAIDASLGFAIVDDAREALAPFLPRMGAGQLGHLGEGVARVWRGRPSLADAAANEYRQMRLAVGRVQDMFRKGDLEPLGAWMGPEAREALAALGRLERRPPAEQAKFFADWGAEAEQEKRAVVERAGLRLAERPEMPRPVDAGRPWAELSRAFFGGMRPLLGQADMSSARTQLLALHALVLRDLKARRSAPPSLDGYPEDLIQDPFGRGRFVYRSDRQEYVLYSVGPDQRDNGGESDESGMTPDVVLAGVAP
jgi:hypothetical protein